MKLPRFIEVNTGVLMATSKVLRLHAILIALLISTSWSVAEACPGGTLNVRQFGAKGDGKANDLPAINAAIRAAAANAKIAVRRGKIAARKRKTRSASPNTTVCIPKGTYLLDAPSFFEFEERSARGVMVKTNEQNAFEAKTLIKLLSGVNLMGATGNPEDVVLKVANGLNSKRYDRRVWTSSGYRTERSVLGFYQLAFNYPDAKRLRTDPTYDPTLRNVSIAGMTFDHGHNPVLDQPGVDTVVGQNSIGALYAENFTLKNCVVRRTSGSNAVVIDKGKAIRVIGNNFIDSGNAVPGTTIVDHSTLYLVGEGIIQDNMFINTAPRRDVVRNVTAVEVHGLADEIRSSGWSFEITGNYFKDVTTGINAGADLGSLEGVLIDGNYMEGVRTGVLKWRLACMESFLSPTVECARPNRMGHIQITNNYFGLHPWDVWAAIDDSRGLFYDDPQLNQALASYYTEHDLTLDDVEIEGNVIEQESPVLEARGILLCHLMKRRLSITNNVILAGGIDVTLSPAVAGSYLYNVRSGTIADNSVCNGSVSWDDGKSVDLKVERNECAH
jgi:hypothetical protein